MVPKLKAIALTPLIAVVFFSLYIRFPSVSRHEGNHSGIRAFRTRLEIHSFLNATNSVPSSANGVSIGNGTAPLKAGSHSRKQLESLHSNVETWSSIESDSPKINPDSEKQRRLVAERREHYNKLASGDFLSEISKRWGEGDDERTECLSRYEQHEFRKASGPKKSAALVEAMKEYEEFHRDCRLKESDVGNLNTAFLSNTTLPCRYLVWLAPYDGMGNRLLSLVSTYLYALLTKRVLVMDRRWKMEELLCDPFTESSIFLPKYVTTTKMISQALNINAMSDQAAALRDDGKAYTPAYSTIAYVNHEPDMRFFCESDLKMFDQSHVVLLLSNMYYVPGFYLTSYREEVERLFPDRRVFVHLSRYLLNPSNEVWHSIKEFYDENLRFADRQIGMQLRLFNGYWEEKKSQTLLNCALENNLLPRVEDEMVEELKKLSVNRKTDQETPLTTTVCLIASLAPQFYSHLHKLYHNKSTQGNVVVQFKRAGQESQQRSEETEHNKQVLKEMWLLSFSDEIIASPASTFGYIATGLSGKTPLLLEGLASSNVENDQKPCWRYESPEPCYHGPPWRVRCPSDGTEIRDPWNQLPFIRHCHDFPRGIQVRMTNFETRDVGYKTNNFD